MTKLVKKPAKPKNEATNLERISNYVSQIVQMYSDYFTYPPFKVTIREVLGDYVINTTSIAYDTMDILPVDVATDQITRLLLKDDTLRKWGLTLEANKNGTITLYVV